MVDFLESFHTVTLAILVGDFCELIDMEEEPVHSWSGPESNRKIGVVSDIPGVVDSVEGVADTLLVEDVHKAIETVLVLLDSATVLLVSFSVHFWHVQIWLKADQHDDLMG